MKQYITVTTNVVGLEAPEACAVLHYITNDINEIKSLEKLYSDYAIEIETDWFFNNDNYDYCFKVFLDKDNISVENI